MKGQNATARACANIALAKYWGKADEARNLPSVPSISLTLRGLVTETNVDFTWEGTEDEAILNGEKLSGRSLQRVQAVLDEVRRESGIHTRARVSSHNNFPTGSGLASSASGFAALVAAAYAAASLSRDYSYLSRVARRHSASAARSLFGGIVYLPSGADGTDVAAEQLFPEDYWDLSIVVAVMHEGAKEVSSTNGMLATQHTSPYYEAWVREANARCLEIRNALDRKDFSALGRATEQSAFAMHASALAACPPVVYWLPGTLQAIATVRRLRTEGVGAWVTMDAGPHVKVLCLSADVHRVELALAETAGVLRTIRASLGPGIDVGCSNDPMPGHTL